MKESLHYAKQVARLISMTTHPTMKLPRKTKSEQEKIFMMIGQWQCHLLWLHCQEYVHQPNVHCASKTPWRHPNLRVTTTPLYKRKRAARRSTSGRLSNTMILRRDSSPTYNPTRRWWSSRCHQRHPTPSQRCPWPQSKPEQDPLLSPNWVSYSILY